MSIYKISPILMMLMVILGHPRASLGGEIDSIRSARGSIVIRMTTDAFSAQTKEAENHKILEEAGLMNKSLFATIPFRSTRPYQKKQNFIFKNLVDNSTAPRVIGQSLNSGTIGLQASFDGINAWNQRYSNGGNNKAFEPPDQGLCVGNGYILESVNSSMRIYQSNGSPLTQTIDLNAFYGYPPGINRETNIQGPFIFDPSCLYDEDTQRWFHVAAVQEIDPLSGQPLPKMHLDIAVSKTADPTAEWVTYQVAAQNDGTQGTPDHKCGTYCLGDFPHIGSDRYGFYLTTNEFAMESGSFRGAQIYAFSKLALAQNKPVVDQTLFDTAGMVATAHGMESGFTVWPAQSPKGEENKRHGGVIYFLSSVIPAGENVYSEEIVVWAIRNTRSLNDLNPRLSLSNAVLASEPFGQAPMANQKPGSYPLGECLNDRQELLGPGRNCWQKLMDTPPQDKAVIGELDSNDVRMQQVSYVNKNLYGALDTIVNVNHEERAGIAYFVVRPRITDQGVVAAKITRQGYLASQGHHLIYPAFGVLKGGKGAMGFTIVSESLHPSAGYVVFDGKQFGDIYIAANGAGVQDGKTEYPDLSGGDYRPRWGDYGAVATDGRSIWVASEYISQSCTLDEYVQAPFGTCGGTRTEYTNWATRISEIHP